MPRGQPADRAKLAEVYRLFTEERMTYPAIGKRLGISSTAASQAAQRWRALNGIAAGTGGSREGVPNERKVSNVARDAEIVRLFHAEGVTRRKIAKRLSVSYSTVANVLYLHGSRTGAVKRGNPARMAVKDGPRCACGLLLPCYHLPLSEVASSRLSPVIETGHGE